MRGENFFVFSLLLMIPGTSPRARGKLFTHDDTRELDRNIPACAGKTNGGTKDKSDLEEHPRVRGENSSMTSCLSSSAGTSPRARGKLGFRLVGLHDKRNIPACAGKTDFFVVISW